MHTLGLSTFFFFLEILDGCTILTVGGSPGVSLSWRPEGCWRLNARIPPPLPLLPTTQKGLLEVLESPLRRQRSPRVHFAELLRASVHHSSSAWGLWAQERATQHSQKVFLPRATQKDKPGSETAGVCDGKTQFCWRMYQQNVSWGTMELITDSLSENTRLYIWAKLVARTLFLCVTTS